MIDAILSNRPEDRRNLFEEAAGIGKYKDRRRGALRRLEQTDQDLMRLEDVIGEVQTKVRSLARQKGKAERHKKLRDRRLIVEVNVVRGEMLCLKSRLKELDTVLRGEGEIAQEALSSLSVAEAVYEKLKLEEVDAERGVGNAETALEKVRIKLVEWERDLAVAEERRSYGDRRLVQLKDAKTDHAERKTTLASEIDAVAENFKNQQQIVVGLKTDLSKESKLVGEQKAKLDELRKTVKENEKQELDLARKVALMSGEIESTKGQLGEFERAKLEIETEVSGASEALTEILSQGDLFENRMAPLEDQLKSSKEQLTPLAEKLEASRNALDSLRSKYLATVGSVSALRGELVALEDLEARKEGTDDVVRALLGLSDHGVLGVLMDFVEVPNNLNVAVESYLGPFCQAVVVENQDHVEEISRWFENQWEGGGGLILLPCDQVPEVGEGSLLEVISTKGEGGGWAKFLIGSADILDTTSLSSGLKRTGVSPQGTVVDPSGFVRIGNIAGNQGMLERKSLISELQQSLISEEEIVVGLSTSISEAEQQVGTLEEALAVQRLAVLEVEDELRRTDTEIQNQMTRRTNADSYREEFVRRLEGIKVAKEKALKRITGLKESRGNIQIEQDRIGSSRESSAVKLQNLQIAWETSRVRENQLEVSVARNEVIVQGLKDKQLNLNREQQEEDQKLQNVLSEQITLQEEVREARKIKDEGSVAMEQLFMENDLAREGVTEKRNILEGVEKALEKIENEVKSYREKERSIADRRHTFELERQELTNRQDIISDRLQSEWGKPVKTLLEEVESVDREAQDLNGELEEILAKLSKIGLVNMLAVEEHEEESQRLVFLSEQREDLLNAKKDLLEAIRQVNETATNLFDQAFGKIRENFSDTFERLFEGGTADIWLTDPTDPLESGIEIHASPKGKRTQRIELLSGGERALTALSLLFGIYLFKPSPFCVLDEVDAPLDENNIGRFIRLLDDFKEQTQFILITHNPRSIEAADWIYGVTMEEPGVSSIVGVRLEESDKT
jgi:chromosome segregation protein